MSRSSVALALVLATGLVVLVARGSIATLLRPAAPSVTAVEDRARLLGAVEQARIAEYHAALRRAHDIDYRVLALDEAGDLERTARDHFAAAGVGSGSANGRGLLLVIDSAGERVRLEVSTSLEGVYTDAFVAYVQSRQMAPFFAAGRVTDGVLATTELIVGRAQEALAGHEFAPPMQARSEGAGATAAATIGTANAERGEFEQQTLRVAVDASQPLNVVEAYHERMANRDARTDLPLYSSATVAMLRDWVVTPAQMDNVVRAYRGCTVDEVRIRNEAAVVRYSVEQRRCAPYFLRREHDSWKLDLKTLSSTIAFNHENEWRFRTPLPDNYAFGFDDWRIDGHGFPHPLVERGDSP